MKTFQFGTISGSAMRSTSCRWFFEIHFLCGDLGTVCYLFLTVFNLVKDFKIKIPLQAERSPPFPPDIQILVSEVQSECKYFNSKRAHFWTADTMLAVLDLFVPGSTSFLQHFS